MVSAASSVFFQLDDDHELTERLQPEQVGRMLVDPTVVADDRLRGQMRLTRRPNASRHIASLVLERAVA